MKLKVLFICIHNSARSQMAEALLRAHCGETFEVHSAGLQPGTLNPLAVKVMAEIGMDISGSQTKSVYDYLRSGAWFHHIITVCDEANAEKCPIFPGVAKRHHWGLPDPAGFKGSEAENLRMTREVRDIIQEHVADFCALECVHG